MNQEKAQRYLDEFREYLINYSDATISQNTVEAYLRDTRYFLQGLTRDAEDAGPDEVEKFIAHPSFSTGKSCSPKTRRRRASSLRAFFNCLVNRERKTGQERIKYNPVPSREQRIRARTPKVYPSYLKPNEVDRVLGACEDTLEHTIVMVLWRTGIRLAELLTCQAGNVNLASSVYYPEGDNPEIKVVGKGNKERYIPIPVTLVRCLEDYIATWREAYAHPSTTELIVGPDGGPLSKDTVEYIFKKLSKRTGIHVHPHKLRHSFATDAIDRGMNPKAVQAILGHESNVVTDWYVHSDPGVRDEVRKAYP